LGDLDGDGDPDLVIGNYSGTFNYYENTNPTALIPDEAIIPSRGFSLASAYPNPFNRQITFRGTAPASAGLTLQIYDLLGHSVGYYRFSAVASGAFVFNLSWPQHLPTGLYFYIMNCPDDPHNQNHYGRLIYLK